MKRDSTPTERRRDPENTRNALLDAAFSEMHLNGFRAASLDKIFAEAGITRGALYHHFAGKLELGYAVVDERILPGARERFISPFLNSKDIFGAFSNICARVSGELNHDEALLRGCPMINLAQEMSGIDDGFRLRLAAIHEEWRDAVAVCIRRSQAEGTVRQDIEPREVGTFIVAAFQGAIGFAKNARDREPFELCRKGLESYVTSLSPDPKQRAA
jgi:TetR/AcrR family transcriptional repressor of nem operon